jgi:N-acetyl-anhydromuramyl-L-alanine amidase AmpD
MNLKQLIFTENACYKAGKKITPKGIMVHSTGANNPNLKRYVGPDDGLLGKNQYNNHWNQAMSRQVCVHAFIGKLADGSVATYQTLPWNHRGWHCGGAGNNTHIGFEICEDGLTDGAYFAKVYKEAVELCAYLCKMYGLSEDTIICHSEGHKKGIATNHGDVMHWFPKHGKSMDTFRADVKALLNKDKAPAKVEAVTVKMEVLSKGSKGEQVKTLQRILKSYGYQLGNNNPYDGNFGKLTDAAVREFQADNNLPITGDVDEQTWAKLLGIK